MAIPTQIDEHLQKREGKTYSVSGTTGTFPTQSFDHHQLASLMAVAHLHGYALSLVAGVLTLSPGR